MKEEGITFVTGTNVGKDVKASKLLKEYDRVILACGAKNPRHQGTGTGRQGNLFRRGFFKSNDRRVSWILS